MKHYLVLFAATVALTSTASAMYRQWSDREGKFSIEAEFIAFKDGKIYLEKKDGSALSFPVDKLSRADREYLRTLSRIDEKELFNYLNNHQLQYSNVVFVTQDIPSGCGALAFSPNGRLLAMGTGSGLHVVDMKTSTFVSRVTNLESTNTVVLCQFSPDGKKLITKYQLNIIRVWKVDERGLLTLDKEYKQPAAYFLTALAVSPDGSRAFSEEDEGIRCWDLETAAEIRMMHNPRAVKPIVCFTDAKRTRALVTDGRKLVQYDLETTKVTNWMTLSKTRLQTPAISPGGNLVAVSDNAGIHLWKPFEATKLATLDKFAYSTKITFSPDGRFLLAACSEHLRLWSVEEQKHFQSYRYTADNFLNAIAFSPDSQYFAASTGKDNRTVQVFRIPGVAK
jgi:WD40 repeat protein